MVKGGAYGITAACSQTWQTTLLDTASASYGTLTRYADTACARARIVRYADTACADATTVCADGDVAQDVQP
jgi:hypothetical protein